jgi:hypothetical protein
VAALDLLHLLVVQIWQGFGLSDAKGFALRCPPGFQPGFDILLVALR